MRQVLAAAAIAFCAIAAFVWWYAGDGEERVIRQRLEQVVAEFNSATIDGIGAVTRSARIGQFFTPDVVVELGKGSSLIQGRETLMGMAARLQPRTAAFVVSLNDIGVEIRESTRAEATFTLVIRQRGPGSGDESIDAREFSAELRKDDGTWRISHVTAIDTFR